MALMIASFVGGLVFGLGLLISGMTEPAKVLGFLDIFGAWERDPRLRDGRRSRRCCTRLRAGAPPQRTRSCLAFFMAGAQ